MERSPELRPTRVFLPERFTSSVAPSAPFAWSLPLLSFASIKLDKIGYTILNEDDKKVNIVAIHFLFKIF